MKATELKKGDWVSYNGKSVKIYSLDMYAGCGIYEVGDLCMSTDGKLAPLPLTTEIMEKNGWEKDRDNYMDYDHHLMLCEKSNGYALYKVVNENIIWLMNIKYIHQLQHILWALGIDDDLEI